MLVSSGPLPPDSEKWSYEVKWDGFRALIHVTSNSVTITSRNGHDMSFRYPELQAVDLRARSSGASIPPGLIDRRG